MSAVAENPSHQTILAYPLYDEIHTVRISPPGGLFIEPVLATMSTDLPGGEIVYTLDGTEPTLESRRYKGPLHIETSMVVRARVVADGRALEQDTRAAFSLTKPRPREAVHQLSLGLAYKLFEGEWRNLPDFDALTPVSQGTVARFELNPRRRDEYYGFVFSGYLRVPRDGVYTLTTESDDGSRLYIGDRLLVDNDGLHGARERRGKIALQEGFHRIRVLYFERTGDDVLRVFVEGPDLPKQDIPRDMLKHSPE
jgi:hypothetical protein